MATAVKKKKNGLPTGISKRKDGYYIVRKSYKGQKAQRVVATVAEAKQVLVDLEYELKHGIYFRPEKVTMNKWFDDWIEVYKKPKCKPGTIKDYTTYYNNHLRDTIGNCQLSEIKTLDLQRLLNDMQAEGYSQKSLDKVYMVVNQLYKQAVKTDLLQKNPCINVTIPKGKPTKRHVALTTQQQGLFINALETDNHFTPFVLFMLYTGLRVGEAAALCWKDIDFDKKEIHVRRTVHSARGKDIFDTPKSSTSNRVVPLIPKAIELLKSLKKQRDQNKVVSFDGLVFHYASGRAYEKNGVNYYLERISKKIIKQGNKDYPIITSHVMRHTFATRAIENGMMPQTLKEILGHSKLSTTMDIYAHVLPSTKAKEMDMIAVAF